MACCAGMGCGRRVRRAGWQGPGDRNRSSRGWIAFLQTFALDPLLAWVETLAPACVLVPLRVLAPVRAGASARVPASARAHALASALALLGALGSSGCAARRELIVLSDPPGASVRLDQQIVGETPYQTRFEAFGTRRVTLYMPGYRTDSRLVKLQEPWFAQFPFDFFTEVLIPVRWSYRKEVRIKLQPEQGGVSFPDLQDVLDRAEILRKAGPEGPKTSRTQTRREE